MLEDIRDASINAGIVVERLNGFLMDIHRKPSRVSSPLFRDELAAARAELSRHFDELHGAMAALRLLDAI